MEIGFIEKFEGHNFQLWKWHIEIILREKGTLNVAIDNETYLVDRKRETNTFNNLE